MRTHTHTHTRSKKSEPWSLVGRLLSVIWYILSQVYSSSCTLAHCQPAPWPGPDDAGPYRAPYGPVIFWLNTCKLGGTQTSFFFVVYFVGCRFKFCIKMLVLDCVNVFFWFLDAKPCRIIRKSSQKVISRPKTCKVDETCKSMFKKCTQIQWKSTGTKKT